MRELRAKRIKVAKQIWCKIKINCSCEYLRCSMAFGHKDDNLTSIRNVNI